MHWAIIGTCRQLAFLLFLAHSSTLEAAWDQNMAYQQVLGFNYRAPASVCAPFLATCCVAAPAKCKRERALAWTVGRDPPHLGRCSPVVLDVARVRGRGRTGAATVPVCGAAPHLSATNTFWVKINLARLVALGRRRRRNLRLLLFSRRRPSSVRRASHQSRFLVCFSQL